MARLNLLQADRPLDSGDDTGAVGLASSMPSRRDAFAPYATDAELSRGRRRMLVYLAIAVAAAVLAMVAEREVGDSRLVTVYVVAAVMHLVSALAAAIRWSRTTALQPAD